jgi:hypothetical protein
VPLQTTGPRCVRFLARPDLRASMGSPCWTSTRVLEKFSVTRWRGLCRQRPVAGPPRRMFQGLNPVGGEVPGNGENPRGRYLRSLLQVYWCLLEPPMAPPPAEITAGSDFPTVGTLWPGPNNELSFKKSSFGARPDRIEARRIDANDLEQTKCRKPNLSAQPLVPGLICETGQSSCCRLDRSDNEAPGFEIAIFRDACRAACYVR